MVKEIIEYRDFSSLIPDIQNGEVKWETREYKLLDLTAGKMLWADGQVSDMRNENDDTVFPCELIFDPGLSGIYTVDVGIPMLYENPMYNIDGIDLALDGENFVHIYYDVGVRYGRALSESGVENFVRFGTYDMTGRKLRIRIPYGTCQSVPAGYVRAALSCLRFIPSDTKPTHIPAPKDVGVVVDGFSHYFYYAKRGENLDLRIPDTYRDTDVNMVFHQIDGKSQWKSAVTTYPGENLTKEDYDGARSGDIRFCDYIGWSVNSERNLLSEEADECHKYGKTIHFSVRANLYWNYDHTRYGRNFAKLHNGGFWMDHQDCLIGDGSPRLDYGREEVRKYILTLFEEALENADYDGINLDLTRWAPILKKGYHTPGVITSFVGEMRRIADEYAKRRGKKIEVSVFIVEGHLQNVSFEDQCIDFDALMNSGYIDFVCVQTDHFEKYVDSAHKNGVRIYGMYDLYGAFAENGMRNDPLWTAPDYEPWQTGDVIPGEEFVKKAPPRSRPAPWEIAIMADRDYKKGSDGFVTLNRFYGDRTLGDLGDPGRAEKHARQRDAVGQYTGDYIFLIRNKKQ